MILSDKDVWPSSPPPPQVVFKYKIENITLREKIPATRANYTRTYTQLNLKNLNFFQIQIRLFRRLVDSGLAAFITSLRNTSVPTATCFPFHIPGSSGGLPWFDHSAVVLVVLSRFFPVWLIHCDFDPLPARRAWIILRIPRIPIIWDSVNSAISSEFVLRPYAFSSLVSFGTKYKFAVYPSVGCEWMCPNWKRK